MEKNFLNLQLKKHAVSQDTSCCIGLQGKIKNSSAILTEKVSDHGEGRTDFSSTMFSDGSQIFFNKVLDERNCNKENEVPE